MRGPLSDGDGLTVTVATGSSTAYSLPSTLTPNSNGALASSMSYNSSFALTSVTGPNGATQSVTPDIYGRPYQAVSADGATTQYSYTYLPNTQTATISTTTNGTTTTQWKTTTYDGFGRATRVQTGHDGVAVTNVDTQYGACGCSPLGKMTATSTPYAPGSTVYWTTNTYDTSGRTLTQTKPDGSATTTTYAGNAVTTTDPAGKWKTYYSDAAGGLTKVVEPDPNNGSSNPVTYYTLNGAGQIVQVSVQRGGVSQNRSFTWSGQDLASSTDPETGTTSYQYDGNHHVILRTDAKNQQTRYTYDSYERLIEVQYFAAPTCQYCSPQENTGQRVTYGYDVNPNNYNDYYTAGRLTQATFGAGLYNYYYDYNQAGRVTANQFVANDGGSNILANLKATYSWDNQGRMTNMTYPSGAALNYTYDPMSRLSQITSPNYTLGNQTYNASATATYNAASQLTALNYGGYAVNTTINFSESRSYNTLMQLTGLTATMSQGTYYGTVMSMQYNYTAGHNNGRVAQTIDGVLGETVNYTYDMWNRLTAASATNGNWGEQYTFDNFGNLTGKTPTAGTAPSMSVPANLATNQPTGMGSYDANGNPQGNSNYPPAPGYLWDGENRLATDQTAFDTPISYSYDPWGRRVWKQGADYNNIPYTGEFYFYGVTGQKLETYSFTHNVNVNPVFNPILEGINIYFGRKLLQSKGVWVATDKLGSVRATSNQEAMNYWPYGEERTSTANGREKFATYTRDGVGQDYAEQRYYNSNMGAFWTPDPGGIKTAHPQNPLSWNRYAYTKGNPIGRFDPRGLEDCDPDDDDGCYCDDDPDGDGCTCSDDGSECDSGGGGGGGGGGTSEPPCTSQFTDYQVSFVEADYQGAAAVASQYTTSDASTLTVAFLDWGAWESGWNQATLGAVNHNFFGMHPGQWGGLAVPCPSSANQGAACFPAGTSFQSELTASLGSVPHTKRNPNKSNVSYGGFLSGVLAKNPNAGVAALLQGIANAGWNGSKTYGATVNQLTITMKNIIKCLQSLGKI